MANLNAAKEKTLVILDPVQSGQIRSDVQLIFAPFDHSKRLAGTPGSELSSICHGTAAVAKRAWTTGAEIWK